MQESGLAVEEGLLDQQNGMPEGQGIPEGQGMLEEQIGLLEGLHGERIGLLKEGKILLFFKI